ncbi:UNVERIFIED_CONTAM: hypothetical protein Sangu_1854300 [Sesamum angustifolium]|uniref:Uncharacterized protein n=1 Tax=Sesamum angustifolium TaxID=2727405 RepID=A0AAW2M9L1_9LAMI
MMVMEELALESMEETACKAADAILDLTCPLFGEGLEFAKPLIAAADKLPIPRSIL